MDKLQELIAQKETIENQIISEKIKNAKKKRLIVDSIEEIICEDHPNSSIIIDGIIPESKYMNDLKELKTYVCGSCKKNYGYGFKIAYDCPICEGIVLGQPKEEPYNDIRALSGTSGIEYYCKICETQIGRRVIARS